MANNKLAAIGKDSLDKAQCSDESTNGARGVVGLFHRLDGWTQRYFNALARARNHKSVTCHCEW